MTKATEQEFRRRVNIDDLRWQPSKMTTGVFVKDIAVTDGLEMQIVRMEPGAQFPVHTHESPEFIFVLEGELIQCGQPVKHGWASVSGRGTVDENVHSETGCIFLLVDKPFIPPDK